MARILVLLIAAVISQMAPAESLSKTRLMGQFISINQETSGISFLSLSYSANAAFTTAVDTICFTDVLLLNGICIKKEFREKGGKTIPVLRVANGLRNTETKIFCGESSRVNSLPTLEFSELQFCRLSYQAPIPVATWYGNLTITGNVSATFTASTMAVRLQGDYALQGNLSGSLREQEVVGIFQVGTTN